MSQFYRSSGFGRQGMLPPVLKFLLFSNLIIFAIQFFITGVAIDNIIMRWFALWPINWDNPLLDSNFLPWQLLSYQFLHSQSGILHVAFNMFALWMFGTELEHLWGSAKFAFYYILSGIGAGIIHLIISPMFSAPLPAIGASGAVYGILLAFGLTFPNRPIFMFPFFIPIPAKIYVMIFAGIELISGIYGSDGVAHFAHLGGALTGFLLIKFGEKLGIYRWLDKIFKSGQHYSDYFKKRYNQDEVAEQPKWQYREAKEEKPRRANIFNINGEEITQSKIDEILDKISASGYQNLTEREKRILFELSQRLK